MNKLRCLTPNALVDLVPDAALYTGVLKAIDVHAITDGVWANVVADPETQRAIGYVST
jgi:hypothetical protein